ncbi:Trem-like transcript 1 protein [Apodemus speciosus]|uniref:Trem-like transcript 1 protein n=1 Tax=Apodemus speciosus TaxID=105296 RepID=A0ABQ0FQ25_APOSI
MGSSLDPPSRKAPALPPQPPLPPKVLMSAKPVTYATVVFPGGDKGEVASCEPVQDLPNSHTPAS